MRERERKREREREREQDRTIGEFLAITGMAPGDAQRTAALLEAESVTLQQLVKDINEDDLVEVVGVLFLSLSLSLSLSRSLSLYLSLSLSLSIYLSLSLSLSLFLQVQHSDALALHQRTIDLQPQMAGNRRLRKPCKHGPSILVCVATIHGILL